MRLRQRELKTVAILLRRLLSDIGYIFRRRAGLDHRLLGRRHLLNLLTHSRPDVVVPRGALTRRSRLAHVALR
jgi:hypothetical protein